MNITRCSIPTSDSLHFLKPKKLSTVSKNNTRSWLWLRSVQFSRSVVSDSLWPRGLQHARPPYHQLLQLAQTHIHWVSDAIQQSHPVIPFSHLQSFPANKSGSQSTGVSASALVLPMNIQDWLPLGLTGWISLQSKGLSRVFSNTTVLKHQFFGAQLYGPTLTSIHDYWKYHSFD